MSKTKTRVIMIMTIKKNRHQPKRPNGCIKNQFIGEKIMAKPIGKATARPAHHLQKLTKNPNPCSHRVRNLEARDLPQVHSRSIEQEIASRCRDDVNL